MLLVTFTDEQTDWKEGGGRGGLDLSSGLCRSIRVGLLNAASRWQRDDPQNSG